MLGTSLPLVDTRKQVLGYVPRDGTTCENAQGNNQIVALGIFLWQGVQITNCFREPLSSYDTTTMVDTPILSNYVHRGERFHALQGYLLAHCKGN